MTKPSALHGDGINFAFFELLWNKCVNIEETPSGDKPAPILRVPDTVVFLFGLPHQWYFTSKNGGPHKDKTTILRKRRANLTLENIEEVFLTKASSRGGGTVCEDEVVAYFINSKTEADLDASFDAYDSVVDNEISCGIEYFNKETLRNFLHHGRQNKSGILQRFIAPHGGSHNSCIRAIWTPKMCMLERRRTKQALHDKRFALYERAITFDGPDVHSISVPLRGTVLAGRIENICDEIVRHMTNVSGEDPQGTKSMMTDRNATSSKSFFGVGRMAINFKVDGNGKIWILWSNSIRLESTNFDGRSRTVEGNIVESGSQPLNMNTVVKLPSSTKLSQFPSHDDKLKLENKVSFILCPSCGSRGTSEVFQKVPYKTVISHFDKAVEMLKSHPESHPSKVWPPEERFIRAAGGVGFGTLANQTTMSQEALVIPPMIRHINPKLRMKGYQMYRGDPLFLQKTCDVCEDCFLAYAKLTSNSFLMVLPVDPFSVESELHYEIPSMKSNATSHNVRKSKTDQSVNKNAADSTVSIERFDFGKAPSIPPAILEPPQSPSLNAKDHNETDSCTNDRAERPECFPDSDYSRKNLQHMIDMSKLLMSKPRSKMAGNPYEEDLVHKLLPRR